MILTAERNDHVDYYGYDEKKRAPYAVSRLDYEDFAMGGAFVFGQKGALAELRRMMSYAGAAPACAVKNGFATLCDDFFIGDWPFGDYTIPIVKASTGRRAKCLFPYDGAGKLVPYEKLAENAAIRRHYDAYRDRLKGRSLERNGSWHGFGRAQGISDVQKKKYAINALIRDVPDIKLCQCEPGTGVYSGLYILTGFGLDELRSVLFTDDFVGYVATLGKYKSGGYYTYSSKDLARYLNYKFATRKHSRRGAAARPRQATGQGLLREERH
jgi:adenine-specific DNA-methyltransferase